jgi:hypothetical protein
MWMTCYHRLDTRIRRAACSYGVANPMLFDVVRCRAQASEHYRREGLPSYLDFWPHTLFSTNPHNSATRTYGVVGCFRRGYQEFEPSHADTSRRLGLLDDVHRGDLGSVHRRRATSRRTALQRRCRHCTELEVFSSAAGSGTWLCKGLA